MRDDDGNFDLLRDPVDVLESTGGDDEDIWERCESCGPITRR